MIADTTFSSLLRWEKRQRADLGNLCWNKEATKPFMHQPRGDALVEALKFKLMTYFTEIENSEDDYDESDIQLSY